MPTSPQYTLKSHDVYKFTIQTLDALPLQMPGVIQSKDLMRVLVFAAATRTSVHQACEQLERAPSGPTVLGTLANQFRDLDQLEDEVNDQLARLIPKGLGKRGCRVAIDLTALPYHGTVDESHQDEVCRSKAKSGTTHFFTYATAYAVMRGHRYTLAICRVRAKQSMDHVVRTLLERLVPLGIQIKLLMLDRGFYSVRVIRALMTADLPFIMPAVKRGKKATIPGGPTGTYKLAAEKQGRWTSYTLTSAQDGQIEFDLTIVCHNTQGKRGRHQREALLYATWGLRHRPLSWVRATYRGRFGIETSYRQLHQARIRTSSRNPALRLLFVAIALILRNIWVWLHAEVIAQPRRGARQLRLESLRLDRLLIWLVIEIAKHYRLARTVPVYRSLYERAQAFDFIFNY